MESSKEHILRKIRENTREVFPRPDLSALLHAAVSYEDPAAQFGLTMPAVGGKCIVLPEGADLGETIRRCYPDAKRIASAEEGISCATFNPDEAASPAELDGTDLAVIRGDIGVAENGAVWIGRDFRHRAICFIAESLAIILDRKNIVSNMHEAYARIGTGKDGFGVFISGPSKTADIEQALVMGAHGAKDVTVILI